MEIKVHENINATKEVVWQIITNIEHSVEHISAIESVEILNKPNEGLIGLKWVETRILFGKRATETMWVTHAEENAFYQTRAESHGAVYISKLSIEEKENGVVLSMSFNGEPQTFMAKVMSAIMGRMFKKATVKAVQKDLVEIKAAAENLSSKQA